jgi:hypothetical protein
LEAIPLASVMLRCRIRAVRRRPGVGGGGGACDHKRPQVAIKRRLAETQGVERHGLAALQSTSSLLNRVDAEIAAGRVWRAKEILRGNIASGRVEPEVLEAYGRLLAQLGEKADAGKYLFLSGARAAPYSDAISVFRKRIANREARDLVAQLPSAIRRLRFDELAPTVQRELGELGVEAALFGPRTNRASSTSSWRVGFAIAGGLAVFGLFIVALMLGLNSIATWLWSRTR